MVWRTGWRAAGFPLRDRRFGSGGGVGGAGDSFRLDPSMVACHPSTGDHAAQPGNAADGFVCLVLSLVPAQVQFDPRRRARAFYLLSLRLYRAHHHRNLFSRAELGFLLVSLAMAGTLTLRDLKWQIANLRTE